MLVGFRRNSARRCGFTLIEATLTLLIFTAMALIFAAVIPTALQGARKSGNYSQAASLALHKIEQLRGAGFTALQSSQTLAGSGIVDAGSAASVPYTASFANVDHLVGASGTTSLLPVGSVGTVNVCDYNTLNSAVPAGTIDSVTVTISWQGGGQTAGSYSLAALVIQTPHS